MELCVLGMGVGMSASLSDLYYNLDISPNEKRNVYSHLGLWVVPNLSSQALSKNGPSNAKECYVELSYKG